MKIFVGLFVENISERTMSFCKIEKSQGKYDVLHVGGEWNSDIETAISSLEFDALEIDGDMPGGFVNFAKYSDKIKWLWSPRVKSSSGLEELKFVERIDTFDVVVEPKFDYRKLSNLKSLSCTHAGKILPKYINHPNLERLDLEGLKINDLLLLADAKRLRALRLHTSPLKSVDGVEALSALRELRIINSRMLNDIAKISDCRELEILELEKTPGLLNISPVYELHSLRRLFVDGKNATQPGLEWIEEMPYLECAGIWVETKSIDWSVLANHPRLYDISFFASKGCKLESEQAIVDKLSEGGKIVKSFKYFPRDVFPSFSIEFVPSSESVNPLPQHCYRNYLQY